jgi:hypothetical protein
VPALPVVPAPPPLELLPQPGCEKAIAATAIANDGIKSFFNISMLLFEVGRDRGVDKARNLRGP